MRNQIITAALAATIALVLVPAMPALADTDKDHSPKAKQAGDCTEFYYFDKKKHKCVDAR